MILSLLQLDIKWHDIQANLQKADEMIDSARGADLYLLPEMFTTGFTMKPQDVADKEGKALTWMEMKAKQTGAAICATVAIEENHRFFNRLFFVKPDGDISIYDKRHLFSFAGEDKRYEPGKERVVVEWKGVRVLLLTCYDLRFPVFSRNHRDYDLAVYLANWPEQRHHVWTTLLMARAIENQCYVAGVNRTGDDNNCHYVGGSAIINPYGKSIAQCQDNTESVCTGDVDIQKLNEFRKKFPVWEDADEFMISDK